jgi:hypothetical protein
MPYPVLFLLIKYFYPVYMGYGFALFYTVLQCLTLTLLNPALIVPTVYAFAHVLVVWWLGMLLVLSHPGI